LGQSVLELSFGEHGMEIHAICDYDVGIMDFTRNGLFCRAGKTLSKLLS
jgi:hypothetical protein